MTGTIVASGLRLDLTGGHFAFDPTGTTLPTVNILTDGFEYGTASTNPTIGLDPNAQRSVELTYVPKGQVNDQEIRGSYTIRGLTTVQIRFNGSGVSPTQFLIPANRGLDFEYQETPLALNMAASSSYDVPKADYVALSGALTFQPGQTHRTISVVPRDWLEAIPGKRLVAVHVAVEPRDRPPRSCRRCQDPRRRRPYRR